MDLENAAKNLEKSSKNQDKNLEKPGILFLKITGHPVNEDTLLLLEQKHPEGKPAVEMETGHKWSVGKNSCYCI